MNQDTKAKIILGGVVGVVVLFIIIYSMSVYGSNKESGNSSRASFGAPKLARKTYDYNKKIDHINEKKYVQKKTSNENPFAKQKTEEGVQENPFLEANKEVIQPTIVKQPVTQQIQVSSVKNSTPKEEIPQTKQEPKKARRKSRVLSVGTPTLKAENKQGLPSSIPCKVYGDHHITNNSKIKVRITKDVIINSQTIKRNSIITGIARLTNTKVNILFETIQYNYKTIPLNMTAYSRDGLQGIYIEGGIQDDIKKSAYEEAIDEASTSAGGYIPVIGGVVKSATKKENKTIYVDIPNDYTLYLKP